MTTVEEFTEMVNSHDICYDYADDHRAWKKGFNERIAIDNARKELGDKICVPIWNSRITRMHDDVQSVYLWKMKGN